MTALSPHASLRADPIGDGRDELWSALAGILALSAGALHLVAAPDHLAEAHWIGIAFLLLGLGQVGLGLAFRWDPPVAVLLVAFVVHVGVVVLYVASRTVELPFMPPHDVGHEISHLPVAGGVGDGVPIYPGSRIEAVGPLDLACLAAELGLLCLLVLLVPARAQRAMTTTMAIVAVGLLVVRAAWWRA